jgi:hypothetical protein
MPISSTRETQKYSQTPAKWLSCDQLSKISSSLLYESPVMSVIEGTGFHPFVVPARRDEGYWKKSDKRRDSYE